MKFNEEDIKNTTFPSGAMGYKKRDVDDFLINVAKDYGSYQRQLDRSKQEAEAAEREKQELLSQLEKQKAEGSQALEKTKQEKQVLKQQLTDLQTESVSNNLNEDTVLSLAQKVALRIEKQAKEEAQLILTNADQYYEEQLKKLEMKRKEIGSEVVNSFSDLIGSERMIVASIDTVKQEYVRLMNDIREKYEELTEEPMKE
ncbi:DivIVA domain-containing protein [Enterococcus raffinosus]|uniref:DivIVA domain-containing protein n=1 Tax=Enterococcus raffinosus TaxID=71452 RepID=UPI001C1060AA|nr:DivIVA domain-containing protein [Enterococcus raffinosus]MBU5360874.1 DivIVA domain-containing protein [Enterococcus raffinosus]